MPRFESIEEVAGLTEDLLIAKLRAMREIDPLKIDNGTLDLARRMLVTMDSLPSGAARDNDRRGDLEEEMSSVPQVFELPKDLAFAE